ncbi:hypothetical protein CRG98_021891 [Punica granatum]|uniref:Uncharacterized protein n=1 Tax=Punica granatum TaxID=22663 RepID=A0A2I0JP66_PUNGR|nr:hypothetical protein CRG98_021891 [Punica granatum]
MARRAMSRGRPSRPPTLHDRRVVLTFASRPPAAFTLPPWQGELWTEGRSTFPGFCLALGSALAFTASGLGPALGSALAFTASGLGPALGFGPTFGLRLLIGLRSYFWASATHRVSVLHLLLSSPGPVFTTFELWLSIYCFQVLTPHIYYFQAHMKSKIDLDSNSSKRYSKEQV